MSGRLVSIIAPCYNGEKYLPGFFESILAQTADELELVFVDDGSTDRTPEIARDYLARLEARGIRTVYLYQENRGQAAAVNAALKVFSGDYLKWMDSDDRLAPTCIEEELNFLEANPEYGFVLCEGHFESSDSPGVPTGAFRRVRPEGEDTIFEDLILEKNSVFGSGVILVRRESFFKAIPSGSIFESREGQNWQLLLPLTYYCACGYLERDLFVCTEHPDSHSRMHRTPDQLLGRIDGMEELLKETVVSMGIPGEQKYLQLIHLKYVRRRLGVYSKLHDRTRLKEAYRELRSAGRTDLRTRLVYIRGLL